MSFQKLEKKHQRAGTSAVDYPALIINSGRSNSMLNRVFVEQLGLKKKDPVKLDILYDEAKDRFAISVNDDGDWETVVTKARQINLWLGSFWVYHNIYLKGHRGENGPVQKKRGARFVCPLKYSKKLDLWIFKIPDEYRLNGPEKKVSKKSSKKKKIIKEK